jgi:DNA-binding transcriptional ArsR family regulator
MTDTPQGLAELDAIDAVFGALAHRARRHIVQVLSARGGSATAGDLAARFSHSWPTTTRHLGVLTSAGVVQVETEGRNRVYHLDRKHLLATTDLWSDPIRQSHS